MKLKTYLKGLGLGIFITTLIISLSSNKARGEMSDAEIRKRAAELGMVSENTLLLTEAKAMADKAQKSAMSTVSDDKKDKEPVKADAGVRAVSSNGELIYDKKPEKETVKPVSQKEDSVATAGSVTESISEPQKKEEKEKPSSQEKASDPGETVTITVNSGESSISVASKMAEAGLVTDAGQFDSYLVLSGYDRRLVPGSHPIPKGATAEEMGAILTSKQ